jgi:hypothetical protein
MRIFRLPDIERIGSMKKLKIGAALAALLATAAPIAASAATARNIVLVPGAFTDKTSWTA